MIQQPLFISILIVFIIGYCFFLLLEFINPLFFFYYKKNIHFQINVLFNLIGLVIYTNLFFILTMVSNICFNYSIGILKVVPMPYLCQIILCIVVLDLINGYFFHWLSHTIQIFWQIHQMHHTDSTVDVSTSFRTHPLEFLGQFVFLILGTFILGTPIDIIYIYLIVQIIFSQFIHSNIQIPTWLSKTLGTIFVTPNMHKIHHNFILPQRNANYGTIFSIWDKLFGTYNDTKFYKIKYGLECMNDNADILFFSQLKLPFKKPYNAII